MTEKDLAVKLFEGIDCLIATDRTVNPLHALECFLDVLEVNPTLYKDELDVSIKDLCLIAGYLSQFDDVIREYAIEYDPEDIRETFKAASMGNEDACLDMYIFTDFEPDRKYDHFEELVTNVNLGRFYLLKGIMYGSLECKYRLAMDLIDRDSSKDDLKWSIDLLADVISHDGEEGFEGVKEVYDIAINLLKEER